MIKTKTLDFIGGFLFPVFTISEPPAGTNVNQQLPIKLYYGAVVHLLREKKICRLVK